MKVLQICHKMPFPPNDGGTLATYQLSKAMLNLDWEVKLVGLSTLKHPMKEMPLDPVFQNSHPKSFETDTTPEPKEMIKGLWKKNNYIVSRFFNPKLAKEIENILLNEEFDLVVFESLFALEYLNTVKHVFKGHTVLRAHNIEFQLWEERLLSETNFFKRLLLKKQVASLKEYELSKTKEVDVVAAISMTDKAFFSSHLGLKKSVYLPFGIDLPNKMGTDDTNQNRIVFLGALDWDPNLEGLLWFTEKVWPIIHEKNKAVEFHIAGRNAPENLEERLPDSVTYHGEVADAHSYIASGYVLVVPLLTGSGIRIKIIEGLALGQVICTTRKGTQGINSQDGLNVLLADTANTMARQVLEIMKSKTTHRSISANARKLAEQEFDISHTQTALRKLQTLLD